MPKIDAETRKEIRNLPKTILEDIVIKLASKNIDNFDLLLVNYLDVENSEKDFFDKIKHQIELLLKNKSTFYISSTYLSNIIYEGDIKINHFKDICKNQKLALDLILFLLEITFYEQLARCRDEVYVHRFTKLVSKAVDIISTKLHEDYTIEYQDKINNYISLLLIRSNSVGLISGIPKKI